MNSTYLHPVLRQLRDQQVRFAPRDKKIEQVNRAERLLAELEPARTYTYEYLCYRITDYRPTSFPNLKLTGEASRPRSAAVRRGSVGRRRRAGRRGRRGSADRRRVGQDVQGLDQDDFALAPAGAGQPPVRVRRPQAGRLLAELGRTVRRRKHRARAPRHRISASCREEERDEIIARARRLAAAGGCPAEVARRIAKKMSRSVETIRYTLKQFDQEHPDLAIFPTSTGPLSDDAKQKIYQQYRRDVLGRRRWPSAIAARRPASIGSSTRCGPRRIMELPLDYMPNPYFGREGAEKTIFGPMPGSDQPAPRKPGCPPACRRIWPACTKCRC